ncbi:Ig-like domain-containing protein [Tautonia rosea]|uniref:Ig-like domain-containing protein n=1 Tax=Tautonia rosea TaxID=2728037 RepID=UPI001472DE00|nr:Ig-like domain-containing protein [Tautonia rosea]
MSTSRKRPVRPVCDTLEIRTLLSGIAPIATWIGQDGHDFVGRSTTPGPNGVQDIRIGLDNLPADQAVTSAEVRGYGGGIWTYNGSGAHWAAAFVRVNDSPEAALFFEPNRVEVGRPFSVRLWFEDGSTTLISFAGGIADPTFRMPELTARLAWLGQDGSDRVGSGASVGPDGRQDAVITMTNLSPTVAITTIDVRGPGSLAWQSGANPKGLPNAEFVRSTTDPTRGSLFLQPEQDLNGLPLTVTIVYADNTIDLVDLNAGPTNPALTVAPARTVPIRSDAIAAQWLGQANDPIAGPGAAAVSLAGLPSDRTVIGASLSGSDRGVTWAYSATSNISGTAPVAVEPSSRPLTFRRDPNDPTRASIAFAARSKAQAGVMTLRLQYDDGTFSIVRINHGPIDATLKAPRPEASRVVARPGDNLQSLVDGFGAVHLSKGVYDLDRPLILNRAIQITADPGATLRFAQPSNAPAWSSAITVHHGNTTLDGFAVRFAGPVRWDWSVPYDPAVILSTDGRDKTTGTVKVGLVLSNLDLEGPPASAIGGKLEYTALLVNLTSAENGRILDNQLRGGSVRVFNGPWEIAGNTYLGAMPGTWTHDVFAMSWAHDVTVRDNVASPLPGSGKTYRFLVMTQDGSNIRVERNRVEGIGPRDDDPQPHPNNPEVILTEAYHVPFEGMPLALSNNGLILQIPPPQGRAIRSGDVVAVLSGPDAGQWRRIAHVIDPQTLLLDRPLSTNAPLGAVSVSSGFVDLVIADNTVDVRGGSEASPLVLAGAHFGVEVRENHFLGGAPVRIESAASESTVHWAWTHTPQNDVRFIGNTIEESQGGLDAGIVRYPQGKRSQGRTYVDLQIKDNLFAWSPAYFSQFNTATPPTAMLLGDPRSIDPFEIRMTLSGNVVKLPPTITSGATIRADTMTFNGTAVSTQYIPLPSQPLSAPNGLRLVADTGMSNSDRLTSDARLAVDRPDWAVGFEYRWDGQGSYQPILDANNFLPRNLSDGTITVFVRAIDDYGRTSPEARLTFTLDTTPPLPITPKVGSGQDTGVSSTDRVTRIAAPVLTAEGDPGETFVLLRLVGGTETELHRRVGPGPLLVSTPLPDGEHRLAVRRIDSAGNASTGEPLTITIDTSPPAPVVVKLGPGQDTGSSSSDNLTRLNRPTFQAVISDQDRLVLLRDGQAVDQIIGSGSLRTDGPLPDGAYSFAIRRIDAAGNATDGPSVVVRIDTTPPAPVTGLTHLGSGRFQFNRLADAVDYVYRVGNGPTIPLAGATSFRARGLPFDPTPVSVRAIDAAGNLGPEATISAAFPAPTGIWLGQRVGVDLVGRSVSHVASDGFQDVGIALTGLPTDRSIVSAEVRGWGGGIWQSNMTSPIYWKAALVHAPGTDRAELYVQPYMVEVGRPYFVRLNFSDGSTIGVNLAGGPVDPTLRTFSTAGMAPTVGANSPGSRPSATSWRDRMTVIQEAQRERTAQRRAAQRAQLEARQDALQATRPAISPQDRATPVAGFRLRPGARIGPDPRD